MRVFLTKFENDNLRKGCPNSLQKRYKKALNILENKTLD